MPVQNRNNSDNLDPEEIFQISHFETLPVTSDVIARETRHDRVLSRVYEQVMNGWKEGNHDELLKPFYNRTSSRLFALGNSCNRVIVRAKLRSRTQDLLHEGHPGVVRIKAVVTCGGPESIAKSSRLSSVVMGVS
jgi:hypothetical protein